MNKNKNKNVEGGGRNKLLIRSQSRVSNEEKVVKEFKPRFRGISYDSRQRVAKGGGGGFN